VAKNFKDLSEQEILALAISSEETDARIYADFTAGLKADYPEPPRSSRKWRPKRMSIAANGHGVSPRRFSSDSRRSVGVSSWDLDRKLLTVWHRAF